MKKKLVMLILVLASVSVGAGLGFYFGANNGETVKEEIKTVKENIAVAKEVKGQNQVDRIAIVNLDSGMISNGEMVNYGTQLVKAPDEKWEFTSIEDARQGVDSGKYAAYVLIPSNFSTNITSINGTPMGITLEYAIGDNLERRNNVQTVYEILGFGERLNNDLSRLYVASIMKEFHTGQDNAQYIMEQDKKDLETLLAVKGNDLVEMIQLPLVEPVVNNIELLDVSKYATSNSDLISQLGLQYSTDLAASDAELQSTKEDAALTLAGMETMLDSIGQINTIYDETGKTVYLGKLGTKLDDLLFTPLATSKDSLANMATTAGTQGIFDPVHTTTGGMLGEAFYSIPAMDPINSIDSINPMDPMEPLNPIDPLDPVDPLNPGNTMVDEAELAFPGQGEAIANYMADYINENIIVLQNEQIQDQNSAIQAQSSAIEAQNSAIQAQNSAIQAQSSAIQEQNVLIQDQWNAKRQSIIATINTSKTGTSEIIGMDNLLTSIKALSIGESESVRNNLDTEIAGILENKQTAEKDKLTTGYGVYATQAGELETALGNYNPLSYIDQKAITGINTSMSTNISAMGEAISKQSSDYLTYVGAVYESTNNHTNLLGKLLIEGNEASNAKLEAGLEDAKESRTTINEKNEELLTEFTKQLAYSRVGKMENTQVYEFMTAPVSYKDQSIIKQETDLKKKAAGVGTDVNKSSKKASSGISEKQTMQYVSTIAGIVIALIIIGVIVVELLKRRKKDD